MVLMGLLGLDLLSESLGACRASSSPSDARLGWSTRLSIGGGGDGQDPCVQGSPWCQDPTTGMAEPEQEGTDCNASRQGGWQGWVQVTAFVPTETA